ncbi:MAG: response regulator transcription factor [Anaerovoracaceae bacterium]
MRGRKAFFSENSRLTPREREVALLARQRLSAKEIAAQLYISESTVNNTLARVYEKLDVRSKTELSKKNF